MSSPNRTMKLPRLRTKDELLKTSPELFGKLLLGDEMSTARSTAPSAPQPSKSLRAVHSAGRASMHRAPSKGAQIGAAYDTPRGFGDEPLSVDQELAIEMESVKKERQQLMESIAQVKAEAGTAGGEAQQADITQLLKELELKKAKLNELRGDSRKAEADIAKIRDDDVDAQRLTPDGCIVENNYIQGLHDEMAQVDDDLLEADAKNRLYQLLGERTRQEHMALDQKVRDKQDCLRACTEDLANLTDHFNTVRAAKELAQKELAKIKRQVEEARHDWTRKIRERRAEVNELQRRQRKEHEKEVKRREKLQEKEKAERAAQAKLRMEEEAYQLQVAALAPKIEAMEASWNRLRAISGADAPEQVIEYWQGLQAKETRMRDLVALAEKREAACKAEITELLASRSTMYEAKPTRSRSPSPAAAEPEPAAEEEHDEDTEETVEAAAAKIEEAERRMEAAQGQFNKLRGMCVAAEQGMRSLAQRLSLALEAPALSIGPSVQATSHDAGTPAGQSGAGQQGTGPGSRLTSAGGLSSASHGLGGLEGTRRSGAGSVSSAHHHRASRDHGLDGLAQPSALASKAQRLNSNHARVTHPDSASSAGAGGGLALVPEDSSGSRQQRGMAESMSQRGVAASNSRAVLPSRGRNTIEDDSFFEVLPQLLTEVTDKLEKLLSAGQGLDLAAIAAAAAQAGVISSGYSSAASTARRRSGASTTEITPRSAAIRSMHAGLLPAAAVNLAAAAAAAATAAAARASSDTSKGEGVTGEGRESQASAAEPSRASTDAGQGAADATEGRSGDVAPAEPGADAEAATGGATTAADAEQGEQADVAAAADADPGEGAAAESQETEGTAEPQGTDAAAEPQGTDGAAADSPSQEETSPAAPQAESAVAAAPAEAAPAAGDGSTNSEALGASLSLQAAPAPSGASPPATAAASATPSRLIATQSPTATGMRNSAGSSILLNEKALQKGLHRRTWVGAPWMDVVSDNPLDMNLVPSMKRKNGKKKDAAAGPDLNRILGYIPPGDVPAESESDGDGDALGEAGPGDGVVDREYIKMRAAKITARHNAKAAAAAAAQSQSGGR